MMIALITVTGAIIAALIGAIGIAMKIVYDNLQSEKTEIKDSVETLKREVAGLKLGGRYKDDYINALRSHIEQGKPPPPPAYPIGLLRIASEGLATDGSF